MPLPNQKDWIYGEPLVGTVTRIVQDRGFCFILSADKEYFMHHASYSGDFLALQSGTELSFTPVKTPKGLRAEMVSKGQGSDRGR